VVKRSGNGEKTETSLADVVREIRGMSSKLDDHTKLLGSIDRKLDSALRRDERFEARISKLESEVAKLKRRGG
jgi:hypothetical protein